MAGEKTMPHDIALVTDSTCDIPLEWREKYDITVVPVTIVFNGTTYRDGVDMTAQQFYERLPKELQRPTTSQPTPDDFLKAYREVKEKGAKEILAIILSSAMSGTFESARTAAAQMDFPVHMFDSHNNSMGLGWQVIAAARIREAGGGLDEMIKAAQKVRDHMVYFVSLDTIEYLASGGRVADAARFINSILKIKPLVLVKPESGTVGASLPARSRKLAIEGLYREFFRRINVNKPLHITVLHNEALEEAKELADRVKREFSPAELFISYASPVLGVHTGPLAIALCGYAEE
jgi:DegV family protein with EDD domain